MTSAPSRADVEGWFAALLSGAASRDAVDRCAAAVVLDDVDVQDDVVWWALELLHGIDLRHGPDEPYLHDEAQIADWLEEFRDRCAASAPDA